eukprot:1195788-Prorocentrum_minimum.AAC.10
MLAGASPFSSASLSRSTLRRRALRTTARTVSGTRCTTSGSGSSTRGTARTTPCTTTTPTTRTTRRGPSAGASTRSTCACTACTARRPPPRATASDRTVGSPAAPPRSRLPRPTSDNRCCWRRSPASSTAARCTRCWDGSTRICYCCTLSMTNENNARFGESADSLLEPRSPYPPRP